MCLLFRLRTWKNLDLSIACVEYYFYLSSYSDHCFQMVAHSSDQLFSDYSMLCWFFVSSCIALYYIFFSSIGSVINSLFNLLLFFVLLIMVPLLLLQVIVMVAHSSEFENIVARDEEQNELETLVCKACTLELKGGPQTKYGNFLILIQVASTQRQIPYSC